MLFGPCTNTRSVTQLIEKAAASGGARALHPFYGSDGNARLVSVEVAALCAGTCVLRVVQVGAVGCKQAFADDGLCKMVVSAEARRIAYVSPSFAERYGIGQDEACGRTVGVILGPGSDAGKLRTMMAEALEGMVKSGRLLTFSRDCVEIPARVDVTPVHDGTGHVTHLMMTFARDWMRPSAVRRSSASACTFGRVPSSASCASISDRMSCFIKAMMFILAVPGLFTLSGPFIASGASHMPLLHSGSSPLPHALQQSERLFATDQSLREYMGHALRSELQEQVLCRRMDTGGAKKLHASWSESELNTKNKLTMMLDLDKTALYGNDGNDLGIALQWMDKDYSKVKELYRKLINPNLQKAYGHYKKMGKEIQVVIYTRRPQILYYRSCVRHDTMPMRYADDMHSQGQLFVPSWMKTSDQVFAKYSGPQLLDEEANDVRKSLDRLLAARDAVAHALGLDKPPMVVVTAQAKDLDATAQHLRLPVETCLLFDDNAELRAHPRVVLVDPLQSLPSERREELLSFMEAELPASSLPEDLVEYLEEARPSEKSITYLDNGKRAWSVSEAPAATLPSWRTPTPETVPSRSFSHQRLPLGAKGIGGAADKGLGAQPFSNVSPADERQLPLRVGAAAGPTGHPALIDLRAAAEKAAFMRGREVDM